MRSRFVVFALVAQSRTGCITPLRAQHSSALPHRRAFEAVSVVNKSTVRGGYMVVLKYMLSFGATAWVTVQVVAMCVAHYFHWEQGAGDTFVLIPPLSPPLSAINKTPPSGFFLMSDFPNWVITFILLYKKHYLKITRQSAQLDNPERINIYGCWWTVRLNIKGRACSAVKMKLKIHRRSFSTWRLIPSLTPLAIHRW